MCDTTCRNQEQAGQLCRRCTAACCCRPATSGHEGRAVAHTYSFACACFWAVESLRLVFGRLFRPWFIPNHSASHHSAVLPNRLVDSGSFTSVKSEVYTQTKTIRQIVRKLFAKPKFIIKTTDSASSTLVRAQGTHNTGSTVCLLHSAGSDSDTGLDHQPCGRGCGPEWGELEDEVSASCTLRCCVAVMAADAATFCPVWSRHQERSTGRVLRPE